MLDAFHDQFLRSDPYFRCILSLKLDRGESFLSEFQSKQRSQPGSESCTTVTDDKEVSTKCVASMGIPVNPLACDGESLDSRRDTINTVQQQQQDGHLSLATAVNEEKSTRHVDEYDGWWAAELIERRENFCYILYINFEF